MFVISVAAIIIQMVLMVDIRFVLGETVNEECMSMMTLKEPVVFGHETNDPVSILFVIASNTKDKHLEVLMDMSKLLMKKEFIQFLNQCENVKDLLQYLNEQEK